jgi:SAM-dependent methyltransferase
MTMRVLQTEQQIGAARKKMCQMGVSFLDTPLRAMLRRLGLVSRQPVGDQVKSWDVLETLQFLNRHVPKSDPILDIGCYSSEVLVALHKLRYSALAGIDLNPAIKEMPFQAGIDYRIGDFLRTPFSDGFFKAITAISVIEHGFQARPLLAEVSRLLGRQGLFVASFDYWPAKIDTTGVTFFDMDWKIFSHDEVKQFVADAGRFGLAPFDSLMDDAKERVIQCGGKEYTFAWLVLQKQP